MSKLFIKKMLMASVAVLSICNNILGATSPPGFTETWSSGVIDPTRWVLYNKVWGGGNNGTVPQLANIVQDHVVVAPSKTGTTQNVLVLTAQGDQTNSSIVGVVKDKFGYSPSTSPKRVGACIATLDYYASASYLIVMKIGNPNNKPTSPPVGLSPGIWTFHYEEYYPEPGADPTQIDPTVPQYQPRYREGSDNDGWYSTVNSEIDLFEFGHGGSFTQPMCNTYVSEVDAGATYTTVNLASFGINVMDGRYHSYKMGWATQLTPTTLTDDQVIGHGAYYYAADSATSHIQGCPVVKKNGVWNVYEGTSAIFLVDGIKVQEIFTNVSPVSARLIVGAWFPEWAGEPAWDETNIYISEIKIYPNKNPGDVFLEPETYPTDGLVPPLVD